ncbi:helix-turn-helix domain-containing protein [Polaromonas naphthalenivorans]|nr:helix-turn-helix domain-containing protein [Polaromonas naphthalenivorans]
MSFLMSTACMRLKMPGVAKNVLMQLAEISSDHGYAFPSITTLCMRTCWSRTAVIEALKYLEEQKVLWPDKTSGRNTRYWITPANWTGERYPEKESDQYASRTGPPAGLVRQPDGGGTPAVPDPSANRTLIPPNTNELNTPPTPKGAASGFDEFWKTYPKKLAVAEARKRWDKLAPDAALQSRILAAVRVQAAGEAWTRDGGRYVPKASAWLSGERWLDEVAGAGGGVADGDGPVHAEGSRGHVDQVARELGFKPWDGLEQFPVYKARVMGANAQRQQAGAR